MNAVREIIQNNKKYFSHFEYYELLLEKIEKNVNYAPDITIESCKSLIEGVCKTILKHLDATFDVKAFEKEDKTGNIFKRAVEKLAEYSDEMEGDFVSRFGSVFHEMCKIRNDRGDISHGKLAPKEIESNRKFSQLTTNVTSAIVTYMLEIFFFIDFSVKEEIKYDANKAFNEMLDEQEPFGGLSYSKALFEQKYTDYVSQLEEFNEREKDNASV